MSRSRRNPSKGLSGVAIAAAVVGVYMLFLRKKTAAPVAAAPVNGLGFGFSSITKFARKVSKIDPGTRLVKKSVQTTAKVIDKTPAGKAVKRSPMAPLVARINPNKISRRPVAKPGQVIEYQDANGNTITRAQYEATQNEYDNAAQQRYLKSTPVRTQQFGPAIAPGQDGGGQSFSDSQMSTGGGGGGGGGSDGSGPSESDYYGQGSASAPAAAAAAATAAAEPDVMPSAADAAQPADDAPPKKINPLVTIGAFAAIPVIFGLVGKK